VWGGGQESGVAGFCLTNIFKLKNLYNLSFNDYISNIFYSKLSANTLDRETNN